MLLVVELSVRALNAAGTAPLDVFSMEAHEDVATEIAEAVIEALRSELAVTAVNAPMVPAEAHILEEGVELDDVHPGIYMLQCLHAINKSIGYAGMMYVSM
ncbi:hypothetical protein ACFE04_026985 [Oxalis oulophora]